MKPFFTFLFCALTAGCLCAQDIPSVNRNPRFLSAWYSDVSSGRSLSLLYGYGFKGGDLTLYGGLNLYINSTSYQYSPSVYTVFFKEFYTKGFNHIGLRWGIEKKIATLSSKAYISGFYDFQFKAGNIENIYKIWSGGTPQLIHEEHHNLEINSYENTLGLNLVVQIDPRFRFRSQVGLGANFYTWRRQNGNLLLRATQDNWSFNRMFSFGFDYCIGKKPSPLTPTTAAKKRRKKDPVTGRGIALAYDDVHTGRNLNIVYQHPVSDKDLLYAGVKYHINSPLYDNYKKMETGKSYYFKQFAAQDLAQHWGLKLGFEHLYPIPKTNIQVFAFYDFQLLRCTVKNLAGLDFFASGITRNGEPGGSLGAIISGDDPPIGDPPNPSYRLYGPVWAFENYIGAGFKLPVGSRIGLKMQGGIGYNFYAGPRTYDPYSIKRSVDIQYFENVAWNAPRSQVSRMFSLGLEYKFNKRN